MTPREHAAFVAGIKTARQMAMMAAVTIEVRDDAREVRQQAAVAALQGLAAGLQTAFLDPMAEPSPMQAVMALHAAQKPLSPDMRERAVQASADAHRQFRAIERRQEQAVRRQGEMVRARRDAVEFVRGPDGAFSIGSPFLGVRVVRVRGVARVGGAYQGANLARLLFDFG